MATQTLQNHVHRPAQTGLGYLFVVVALISLMLRWLEIGGRLTFAIGLLAIIGAEVMLLVMSRTYITGLQDRIIKLEMRVRAASVLTPEQQRLLQQLRTKQVVALRFASDAELPALVERAAREQLAPADIKRAITSWTPDLDRT